jgi:hypothetical protein
MTNVFNRSYRFYEAGAPYPGVCSTCSNTNKLWDLGVIKHTNQGMYLCDACLTELSMFAGFMLKQTHIDAVTKLQQEITELSIKLDAAPTIIRKLNENVSNILADFVTDLAAIVSKPAATNIEAPKTSPLPPSADKRNKLEAGERTKQSINSSAKSTSK